MAERESRLTRWDPFGELGFRSFGSGLDRILQDLFGEPTRSPAALRPAVDVTETDDRYSITVEVPGVKKGDIHVDVHEGVLTIRGEKRSEREETKEKARLLERSYGAFSRSMLLPGDADGDRIEALFTDGVLQLTIPKRPEAKPKPIAIKG
jgi:HSP20 family protein